MADEWFSPAEIARVLHLPERLVHTLIVEGKLLAAHSPVRVRRSDLDRCLEACRIKPGDLAHLNQYAGGRYRYAGKVALQPSGTARNPQPDDLGPGLV